MSETCENTQANEQLAPRFLGLPMPFLSVICAPKQTCRMSFLYSAQRFLEEASAAPASKQKTVILAGVTTSIVLAYTTWASIHKDSELLGLQTALASTVEGRGRISRPRAWEG